MTDSFNAIVAEDVDGKGVASLRQITDADLQAGHQADLKVDNAHRSIEIRYLKG